MSTPNPTAPAAPPSDSVMITVDGVPRQLADRAELQAALLQYFNVDVDVSRLIVPGVPAWT